MLRGAVKGGDRLAAKEVEARQEVVRAAPVLEAGDELEQNSVDAVAEARLVPVDVERMFLALEEQQHLHVVVVDRSTGQVEMTVAQRLQDAEAATSAAAGQEKRLGRSERHDPRVAVDGRPLAGVRALLGQQVEALGLHLADECRMRPRLLRRRPVRGRARPHPRTAERRSNLDHVPTVQ